MLSAIDMRLMQSCATHLTTRPAAPRSGACCAPCRSGARSAERVASGALTRLRCFQPQDHVYVFRCAIRSRCSFTATCAPSDTEVSDREVCAVVPSVA
eukprot:121588-Pyramimonas_sp.AAC.1